MKELGNNIEQRRFLSDAIVFKDSITYEGTGFLVSQNDDSTWLIDNNFGKVILFDKKFQFLASFGKVGEGPDNHPSLKGVQFLKDSTHLVFDFGQQRIKKMLGQDSVSSYLSFKNDQLWMSDCAFLEDGLVLAAGGTSENFMFYRYAFQNKELIDSVDIEELIERDLGLVSNAKQGKDFIFEGYFSRGDNNAIVYSCNKTGIYLVFDSLGMPVKAFRTIDKLGLPDFGIKEVQKGYFMSTLIPDIYGNYSRGVTNNRVYILSNIIDISYEKNRVIDVYDLDTGEYLHSFLVRNLSDGQRADQISVRDNELIVLYENSSLVLYILSEAL